MYGFDGRILKRLRASAAALGIRIPAKTHSALKPSELGTFQRARLMGFASWWAAMAHAAGIKSETTACTASADLEAAMTAKSPFFI